MSQFNSSRNGSTTMSSDINCFVVIGKLLDDDSFAIIDNQNSTQTNNQDMGIFFDLIKGTINHSIIDLAAPSQFTFTINSQIESQIYQEINSTAFLEVDGSIIENGGTTDLLQQMQNFTKTLGGRSINVYEVTGDTGAQKNIYNGYILFTPDSINVRSGTQFTLVCNTILSQLSQISSNASWQDSTETYGNIFSTLSGNTINYDELLTQIRVGSLSADSSVIKIDGNAQQMPETVWAVILPNKDRLSVVKEILVPYSRIIYQKENGDIVIQPLFINDRVDDIFNVNCYNNYNSTWLDFDSRNAAPSIPNRIDVLFGVSVPANIFGNPDAANLPDIYASTPKIDRTTNTIQSSNLPGVLDYSTVYSTSVRLYNSGKFIMPLMETLSLDNSLFLNAGLLNSITGLYNSSDFSYSNIYVSGDQQTNSIALLYSQIYMAQLNTQNYNATLTYDYLKVSEVGSPLGKIITIDNAPNLDYHEMLVMKTSFSFGVNTGTLYTIETCPLLSICGVWSTI